MTGAERESCWLRLVELLGQTQVQVQTLLRDAVTGRPENQDQADLVALDWQLTVFRDVLGPRVGRSPVDARPSACY